MPSAAERTLGHAAVDRAGELLSRLHPAWPIRRRSNWWEVGKGAIHYALSYQEPAVTNPSARGLLQPTPRVSVELVFDAPSNLSGKFELAQRDASRIHAAMGHSLVWLPNGNSGADTKRHTIRSSRALDAAAGDLASWLVIEFLLLRHAIDPIVGLQA